MKVFNYKLTLTFDMSTFGGPLDAGMEAALNRVLSDWEDGRYQLYTELIDLGVNKCLADAQLRICEERTRDKYGNEMSDYGEGSRISRAYVEARKEFEALEKSSVFPYASSDVTATIEQVT